MNTPRVELVDIQGAAEILATTPRHVKQLQARHALPWVRVGRLVRFDTAALAAYIAQRTVPARLI